MTELRTLQDFQAARSQGDRIYVTDSANGDKVHDSSCPHLKDEYFVQKVIANRNRNGRYYSLASGDPMPSGARRCPVC
jgi:hypothetical protein